MKIVDDITYSISDEVTTIVDSKTGKTLRLDQSVSQIWKLIASGFSKDEIIKELTLREPSCASKICDYVNQLILFLVDEHILLVN